MAHSINNTAYPTVKAPLAGQPPLISTRETVDDVYGVRDRDGKITAWLRVSQYACPKPATGPTEEFDRTTPEAQFALWLYRKQFKNGRRRLRDKAKRAKQG